MRPIFKALAPVFFATFGLAAAWPALADAPPTIGKVMQRVTGNVTGASARQTVGIKVFKVTPLAGGDPLWLGQLVVFGPTGAVVWQGPKAEQGNFSFMSGPGGDDELELAGPIERAGQGEVFVQEVQSDVRVEHFRVLRWNGSALKFVRSSGLVETPAHSGHFVWNTDSTPRSRWIGRFTRLLGPGRCEAQISSETTGGNPAKVTLVATPDGFRTAR